MILPSHPIACALLSCALGFSTIAKAQQPETQMAAKAAPSEKPADFDVEELRRLSALTPAEPRLYLELGEEILDRPDSPARVELARQLFVRAVEYGRTSAVNRQTAASAALALASMSKREGDRRWLRAVAAILEPGSAPQNGLEKKPADTSQAAAASASMLLGMLWAGEGNEARDLLQRKDVRLVLQRHEAELSADGSLSLADLDNESRKWPCTHCANTGMILPAKGQHTPAKICPVCSGSPGMKLEPQDFAAQLRLRRRLLSDAPESWGSLIAADGAPPARDPDAANVAPAFGVNPMLSSWKDGRWVSVDAPPPKEPKP